MTTKEVSQFTGIPRRTLTDWAKCGLLHPHRDQAGRGSGRCAEHWTSDQARAARLLRRLQEEHGYSWPRLQAVAACLAGEEPFATGRYIVLPVRRQGEEHTEPARVVDEIGALSALRMPGRLVLSADVA